MKRTAQYRPDLPTFGHIQSAKGKHKMGNGGNLTVRGVAPIRELFGMGGQGRKRLGASHWADCCRWEDWHKGIENAPEPPSQERCEAQRKLMVQNELFVPETAECAA